MVQIKCLVDYKANTVAAEGQHLSTLLIVFSKNRFQ